MRDFSNAAQCISGTNSKLKKLAFLAGYLRTLNEDDLRAAAVFFTGRPLPLSDARTLKVGRAALTRAVQQISGVSEEVLGQAHLERGDLGEAAEHLLHEGAGSGFVSPACIRDQLAHLATVSGAAKLPPLIDLLRGLSPVEVKYAIKIITGDLRIGLKENLVEEAIAQAFDRPVDVVRRVNMVLGDIGETAVLAKRGVLDSVSLQTFRPIKFMLATPADTEEEIFSTFSGAFYVEDKYDGIRGQLHVDRSKAALYSRTLDDVSHQFSEIIEAAQKVDLSVIADGEVVAFKDGRILPFHMLQKRLGRKTPSPALVAEIPVAFMIFDLLQFEDRMLLDEPLRERKEILETIPWPAPLFIAASVLLVERIQLDPFFEDAARRRNEGLMLKDANSPYMPSKRGMSWLKWKKALATLDVVVTGVELGHGRRRDVLSDYTFAIQHDGKLLNIGKAYSGLTDAEITEMTEFFRQHTIQDYGRFRFVEPIVIIEVAFNGIQKSTRHASGYALRFPRIVRIRQDKTVSEIDTLEAVQKIYERSVEDGEEKS